MSELGQSVPDRQSAKAAVIGAWNAGATVSEISAETGRSEDALSRLISRERSKGDIEVELRRLPAHDPEVKAEALSRIEAGQSVYRVCQDLELAARTVRSWLRRGRSGFKKLAPEEIAEMRTRRAAGDSIEDIARDYGVTAVAVSRHTKGFASDVPHNLLHVRASAKKDGVDVPFEMLAAYLAVRKQFPQLRPAETLNTARKEVAAGRLALLPNLCRRRPAWPRATSSPFLSSLPPTTASAGFRLMTS
jgi:predicted transcriptional regulator